MKITLLGSLGHINRVLIPSLVQAGHEVTVISSNPSRTAAIKVIGAIPAIGSMDDSHFLTRQFTGADAVYLMISGNQTTNDTLFNAAQAQGEIFADAVRKSHVKNVVNLSSLGANNPDSGSLYAYHAIEDQLSKLPNVNVAFIRPVGFYSNLFSNLPSIRNDHAIYSNIPDSLPQHWVDPSDIALVAKSLVVSVPAGKTVHYVYSDTFSLNDFITRLSQALPLPDLHFVPITDKQTRDQMIAHGVPKDTAEQFIKMNVAQRHPSSLYSDFNAKKPRAGNVKLADFVKTFVVAYNHPDQADRPNTVIDH
jgi:uncharacterized protein YbjT (DUF2867 family)